MLLRTILLLGLAPIHDPLDEREVLAQPIDGLDTCVQFDSTIKNKFKQFSQMNTLKFALNNEQSEFNSNWSD